MPDIKSPWPVLADQAQAKLTEAENVLRQARLKEAEAQSSRERVLNMITEYRAKLTQFERQTNLSDSLNCRQFLAQLVDLDVQAQLRVQQMAAARDLAAERGGSAQRSTDRVSRPSEPLKIIFSGLFDTCCPQARGNLPRHSKPPAKFGERTWTEMTHPTAANAR